MPKRKYSPFLEKIFQLEDFCYMLQRHRGKKRMEKQINHQIDLVCADLYELFIGMKTNHTSGTLSTADYVSGLEKYKNLAFDLEGVDQDKLGAAEILQELQNQTEIA